MKAFRGELVPQDPPDEPASEFLARIRTTREAEAATAKAQKKSGRKRAPAKTTTAPAEPTTLRPGGIDPVQAMPFIRGLLRTYPQMTADDLALELYEAFHVDHTDQDALDAVRAQIRLSEQYGIITEDTDGIFELQYRGIADYSDRHIRSIAARASIKGSPTGSEPHITATARLLGFARTSKQIKQRIADALETKQTPQTGMNQ